MTDNLPKNMRRTPDDWQELVTFARNQDFLAGDGYHVSAASADAMLATLDNYDDDTVEELRYYAIGLAACGIAQRLRNDQAREAAIGIGGELLALGHQNRWKDRTDELPALRAQDLDDDACSFGLIPLVRETVSEFDPGTRLLADSLTVAVRTRQEQARPLQRSDESKNVPRFDPDSHRWNIQLGTALADATIRSSMTGTVTTLREFYRIEYGSEQDPNPILEPNNIRQLDLEATSARLAALRLDEFLTSLQPESSSYCLIQDANGNRVFNHGLLATDPPEVVAKFKNRLPIMHQLRLGCPALNITGMLPTMRGLIPDMVETAQERLA